MPVPKFNKIKMLTENKEVPAAEIGDVPILMEQLKQAGEPDILSVKIVPREKIKFHEENQYSQSDIEKLGQSILNYGLLNIPSGYYDEEQDVYVVENGERRTRALDWLIDTYSGINDDELREYRLYKENVQKYERGYPFHLSERRSSDKTYTRIDEIRSRLRLEDANLEARSDPEERTIHIQERIKLLKEYNELVGEDKKYNIPKQIAKDFDISERQAFKYTATSSLIPELQEQFNKKNIKLNDAASFSALSVELQKSVLELIRSGETVDPAEMKKVQEEMERVKNENEQKLREKEETIKLLMEEKEKKEASIEMIIESVKKTAEEEQAKIRSEIEAEFKNANPDEEKLTEMEERLKDISNKHTDTIKQLDESKKITSVKEAEIKRLRDELEQLRSGANEDVIVARIKAEIGYQNALSGLKIALNKYSQYLSANRTLLESIIDQIVEDLKVIAAMVQDIK